MDKPIRTLGASLRKWRTRSHLSLREAAEAAEVDHTTLLRLEGGCDVRLSALMRLCRAHNLRLSESMESVESRT